MVIEGHIGALALAWLIPHGPAAVHAGMTAGMLLLAAGSTAIAARLWWRLTGRVVPFAWAAGGCGALALAAWVLAA